MATKARSTWKGYMKISLVTIPVKLFTAVSTSNKVRLNMLHNACHQRLKQQYVCPDHGKVERADMVKGYEFEKDKYIVIGPEDLQTITLETDKTIELLHFVDAQDVNPMYYNSPYYMAPDGAVAEEAFRVLRTALKRKAKIAIGRVVMSGREQTVTISPMDKGMRLTTLHYAKDVREPGAYFEDIKDGDPADEQIALFEQLIDGKSTEFTADEFRDRYEEALVEVIKAKMEGKAVVAPKAEVEKVVDFMEALRRSVDAEAGDAPPKKPIAASRVPAKKKKRVKRS